jgi:hypothetical protein
MHSAAKTLSITQVLACGAAIVTLSMGIRHGFGLWLQPITQAQGWTRETFAFAIAHSKHRLGHGRNLRRHGGGPFRGLSRDHRRRPVLCRRPVRHGPCGHPADVCAEHGRADRHRPGRHHLCGRLRGDRAQCVGRAAFLGHGHHRRGRFVRAVPDGANGRLTDQPVRLATGAGAAGRRRLAHGAPGLGGCASPRLPMAGWCTASSPSLRRCARPSSTPVSGC